MFEAGKVAFDEKKVAFERCLSEMATNAPTKNKAMSLFDAYGYDGVFGRAEIMQMFAMASSSEEGCSKSFCQKTDSP